MTSMILLLPLISGCYQKKQFTLKQINNKPYSGSVVFNCYDFECRSGFQIIRDDNSYFSIFIDKNNVEYKVEYPIEGSLVDTFGVMTSQGNSLINYSETLQDYPVEMDPDDHFIFSYIFFITSLNNINYLYLFSINTSILYKSIPINNNGIKSKVADNKFSEIKFSTNRIYKIQTNCDKIVWYWNNFDVKGDILCQTKDRKTLCYYNIKGTLLFEQKLNMPMIVSGAVENGYEKNICGYDGRYFSIYSILNNKLELLKQIDTNEYGDLSNSFFNDRYFFNMHPTLVLKGYVTLFNGKRIFVIDTRSCKILHTINRNLINASYGRDILALDDGTYCLRSNHNPNKTYESGSFWLLDKIASSDCQQIFTVIYDYFNYGFVESKPESFRILLMERDSSLILNKLHTDDFNLFTSTELTGRFAYSYADSEHVWVATSNGLYKFSFKDLK